VLSVKYFVNFALILGLATACTLGSANNPPATVRGARPPTNTPQGLPSAIPSTTPEPTLPRSASATPRPTQRATDTSPLETVQVALEPGALSPSGPWLLVQQPDRTLTLINSDLRGFETYELEQHLLELFVAPQGGRVALRVSEPSGETLIQLLSLPRLELSASWPLQVLSGGGALAHRWSPDGRYLAYRGLSESGQPGIAIYDLQQNATRMISQDTAIATLMDWSPDSRWLVYQVLGDAHFERVMAVSPVDGTVQDLYPYPYEAQTEDEEVPIVRDEILGWLTNDTFVVRELRTTGCPLRLWQIRIPNRSRQAVINSRYFDAALDPSSNTLLVSTNSELRCEAPNLATGLYRLQYPLWEPEALELGSERELDWFPELNVFSVGIATLGGGRFLDSNGEVVTNLPDNPLALHPDTAGRTILVEAGIPPQMHLVDRSGELLRELGPGTPLVVQWLPNSSAFFFSMRGNAGIGLDPAKVALFYVAAANDWQPLLVDDEIGLGFDPVLIR
jgi:WD40 repeat protein